MNYRYLRILQPSVLRARRLVVSFNSEERVEGARILLRIGWFSRVALSEVAELLLDRNEEVRGYVAYRLARTKILREDVNLHMLWHLGIGSRFFDDRELAEILLCKLRGTLASNMSSRELRQRRTAKEQFAIELIEQRLESADCKLRQAAIAALRGAVGARGAWELICHSLGDPHPLVANLAYSIIDEKAPYPHTLWSFAATQIFLSYLLAERRNSGSGGIIERLHCKIIENEVDIGVPFFRGHYCYALLKLHQRDPRLITPEGQLADEVLTDLEKLGVQIKVYGPQE